MKPSKKSPEIKKQLESFTKQMFGRGRTDSIENDVCVTCGGEAKEFRNEISKKEYTISGMCQACQDTVFPPEGQND